MIGGAILITFLSFCNGRTLGDFDDGAMENPDLVGGDMLGFNPEDDRSAVPRTELLWPKGIVYYFKEPGLNETVPDVVLQRAFDHYKNVTCIQFRQRRWEKDYIRLFSGQGCYSYVGRKGGGQEVSLGRNCGHEGIVIHELGHAIGFYHEQNRSDRDDYIKINWENIKTGEEGQFFKLKPRQNLLLTPFDYNSIMLYGSYTGSKNRKEGLRTMEGIDGSLLLDPLTKGKLSERDIERINKLYNCK
ncbi:astacin-like metalloprotease toxin 5 [Parasteatoda tepidariorum]|uniref:astacin-like metalloprotease toxin 5 n=1 Tax=Parasteatoda tepidariorum TaxID=114398 RepID=UPI001C71CD3A|nr:astacin-like metalloprotease toxin 5 [Parasteatoda tepidariorum]